MQWYIKLHLLKFSTVFLYVEFSPYNTINLPVSEEGRKEWRKELNTHNQQDDKSLLKCRILIRHQDDCYCLIRTVFLNRDEVIYFSSMKSPCGLWRGLVVRNSGSLNLPSPLISDWGHQLSDIVSALLLRPVASVHLPIKQPVIMFSGLHLICLDAINFPYLLFYTVFLFFDFATCLSPSKYYIWIAGTPGLCRLIV
jgi:hypothetical protein